MKTSAQTPIGEDPSVKVGILEKLGIATSAVILLIVLSLNAVS